MRRYVALALALAFTLPGTAQARGGGGPSHGGGSFAFHNGFFAFGGVANPFRFSGRNFPNNNIVPPLVTLPGAFRGRFGTPFAFGGTFGSDFGWWTSGGDFGWWTSDGQFVSGGSPNSGIVPPLVFMPVARTPAPARPVVTRVIVNHGDGVFADQVIEQRTHGVFRFDGQKTVLAEKLDGGAKIIEFSSTQGGEASVR